MSQSSTSTNGVPESVEYQRSEGANGVRVYECTECGQPLRSTRKARNHTSCNGAPECPQCGSTTGGHVDISTERGRVDVCECGEHFDSGVDP